MPCAGLPELPDGTLDSVGFRWLPEAKTTPFVEFGFDEAARRRRRNGGDEVGVGFAAGFNEAQWVALPLHVGQHLIVLIDQRQRRRTRLQGRRRSCMRQPYRHTGDNLQRLLHPLATNDFGRERLGLVEQAHQPRLELVGQKVPDRADVKDRRRALVEAGAHDIQQPVSFSHLGAAHHHHTLVAAGMDRPLDRNDVGRDCRITRPRKP